MIDYYRRWHFWQVVASSNYMHLKDSVYIRLYNIGNSGNANATAFVCLYYNVCRVCNCDFFFFCNFWNEMKFTNAAIYTYHFFVIICFPLTVNIIQCGKWNKVASQRELIINQHQACTNIIDYMQIHTKTTLELCDVITFV